MLSILMQSCNPGAIEEHTAGEYRTRVYKEQVFPWPFTFISGSDSSILNPPTIPVQSVSETAGVYRTRLGPWAVPFTDCVRIHPRPLKGGTPHIQRDHRRHLLLLLQSYQSRRNPQSHCNPDATQGEKTMQRDVRN